MSAIDHLTDEDIHSLTTKNEMLSAQLELAYAMIDVALGQVDHKVDYEFLKTEARHLLTLQKERNEQESLPPLVEPMDG